MFFSVSIEMITWLSFFTLLIQWIILFNFFNVKPSLYFWNESHLTIMILICCWIWFDKICLEFLHLSSWDILLLVFSDILVHLPISPCRPINFCLFLLWYLVHKHLSCAKGLLSLVDLWVYNVENLGTLFLPIFFCPLISFGNSSYTYIGHLKLSHSSLMVFSLNKKFFFSSYFILIVSITISSNLLIFSPAMFNFH